LQFNLCRCMAGMLSNLLGCYQHNLLCVAPAGLHWVIRITLLTIGDKIFSKKGIIFYAAFVKTLFYISLQSDFKKE